MPVLETTRAGHRGLAFCEKIRPLALRVRFSCLARFLAPSSVEYMSLHPSFRPLSTRCSSQAAGQGCGHVRIGKNVGSIILRQSSGHADVSGRITSYRFAFFDTSGAFDVDGLGRSLTGLRLVGKISFSLLPTVLDRIPASVSTIRCIKAVDDWPEETRQLALKLWKRKR